MSAIEIRDALSDLDWPAPGAGCQSPDCVQDAAWIAWFSCAHWRGPEAFLCEFHRRAVHRWIEDGWVLDCGDDVEMHYAAKGNSR